MAKYVRGNRQPEKRLSTLAFMLFVLLMTTVLILMLVGHSILSHPTGPGNTLHLITYGVKSEAAKREKQWSEILSWEPRASLYHNFLSKEECEYLINAAKPHMEKSEVVDEKNGQNVYDSSRTSTGTFFERGQDKVILDIEKRIADYTFIPPEHGEGLQVLHYAVGQKYEPHHDYFEDEISLKSVGQRVATVLMYLSDVEEGGETVFPIAKGSFSWNETLECGKRGLSVKPKMGDALLFWNLRPDATQDPSTYHGACPVIKGNKWVSTKWIHVEDY